jgi:hypothetical protein
MSSSEPVSASDTLRSVAAATEPDARVGSGQTLADQHELIAVFVLNREVPHDIRVHFETAKNLFLYAWFVYRFYPVAKQHALATLEFALRERLALIDVDRYRKDAKPRLTLYPLLQAAEKESLISNTGLRAYHRRAVQQARERVSETAGRLLWAFEADSVEYDLDSAVPQDEDYAWDTLKTYQEVLPKIRNIYAHGSSNLTANVLGTFETVADLVNQLFPLSDL